MHTPTRSRRADSRTHRRVEQGDQLTREGKRAILNKLVRPKASRSLRRSIHGDKRFGLDAGESMIGAGADHQARRRLALRTSARPWACGPANVLAMCWRSPTAPFPRVQGRIVVPDDADGSGSQISSRASVGPRVDGTGSISRSRQPVRISRSSSVVLGKTAPSRTSSAPRRGRPARCRC